MSNKDLVCPRCGRVPEKKEGERSPFCFHGKFVEGGDNYGHYTHGVKQKHFKAAERLVNSMQFVHMSQWNDIYNAESDEDAEEFYMSAVNSWCQIMDKIERYMNENDAESTKEELLNKIRGG